MLKGIKKCKIDLLWQTFPYTMSKNYICHYIYSQLKKVDNLSDLTQLIVPDLTRPDPTVPSTQRNSRTNLQRLTTNSAVKTKERNSVCHALRA